MIPQSTIKFLIKPKEHGKKPAKRGPLTNIETKGNPEGVTVFPSIASEGESTKYWI